MDHYAMLSQSFRTLGAAFTPSDGWKKLFAAYSPQEVVSLDGHTMIRRAYHNIKHIEHCIAELNCVQLDPFTRALVETAIWYHDVIYTTRGSISISDELASAHWAHTDLMQSGARSSVADSVYRLILFTEDHWCPISEDERLVSDLDLSILGAQFHVFCETYEEGIRKEYGWAHDADYYLGRKDFVSKFLAKRHNSETPIYYTDFFRKKYEKRAWDNLLWLEQHCEAKLQEIAKQQV